MKAEKLSGDSKYRAIRFPQRSAEGIWSHTGDSKYNV